MLLRHISVLAVLTLSIGSTVALADTNPYKMQTVAQNSDTGGTRQMGGKNRLMPELNLTQQQTEQIQAIKNKYKGQMSQQRQALNQAQQELKNMMVGTASEGDIRQKHTQVLGLRQQMEESQFNSLLEMRAVMTPEQRTKFAQMMQSRRTDIQNRKMNKKVTQG